MKRLFISFLIVHIISGLSAQTAAGIRKTKNLGTAKGQVHDTILNTVTIGGQFESKDSLHRVVLLYGANGKMITDSFIVAGNRFSLKKELSEPLLAGIIFRFKNKPGEEKQRYERLNVFLEPGKMEIQIKDSAKFARVTGSKSHTDFEKLTKDKNPYEDLIQELRLQYNQAMREKSKSNQSHIEEEMEKLDAEMKEAVYLPFLNGNINSPIAVYVLNEYAGYSINAEKIEPIYKRLSPTLRQSASGIALGKQIAIAKMTGIGVEAMDFTQPDTLGIPVSLKSFRGKYVLLDFWASWCGPCRAENPNVVKAFQDFKDKNFTVLSVSLDKQDQKEAWMKAIHKDGLTWTHVSDLNYFDNAVARQYGIRAIPQNLLIDPKGKIVAKNLRGAELESALIRLLQ